MTQSTGKVTFIGAGPGDPGLITLRGWEALKQADIVLYDYLVNPIILQQAGLFEESTQVTLVCLGRHGEGRMLTQEEINEQMVAAAKSGRHVVRLKGGDPGIFGRTVEEITALEAAAISYEIVPGVTAALAASSVLGTPLTDRRFASAVAFVTGHECNNKQNELDLVGLARFPGTLVFYMGVTTAPNWSLELIAHGKLPETPVAIVRRCGLPGQQVIYTQLDQLPEVLAPAKIRPPAVVIVGEVARLQSNFEFLSTGHLFGRTVLVTRPDQQTTETVMALARTGATAMVQPAIEICGPESWDVVDDAIARLPSFDWLVFSSANGVRYFLDRILQSGGDLRQLASCRLAAIGPATADTLLDYSLRADLQPNQYRAEALATELISTHPPGSCLLLRASRGREVLSEMLTATGWNVEQVVVYQSTDVAQPAPDIRSALEEGRIDWVTVTSSAIARGLVKMFGDDLYKSRLAAISPLTAEVLTEAGFPPQAVAEEYTTAGLIDAMLAHDA